LVDGMKDMKAFAILLAALTADQLDSPSSGSVQIAVSTAEA